MAEDRAEEAMLTTVQARVAGSLMEKQMATPEYYPLTLNALVAACNQKSSRNPVMTLTAQQVMQTINELRHEGIVAANSLGRAERYEQFLSRKLQLDSRERAVICTLLLRGAQTVNEIRTNTTRMTKFSDTEAIMSTLKALMARDEPLVVRIPKTHGQREDRFDHLLCGDTGNGDPQPAATTAEDRDGNEARISRLEQEVAELKREIERLKRR